MKQILLVLSSPRGGQSYSHQVARHIVDQLKWRQPGASVVVRDLASRALPPIDAAFVGGIALPADKRTPAQIRALATSDALATELIAADVVVIAAPMHNFGVPASLKAWIDHVVRLGITFSYTEKGRVGLAKGKRAILALARGGIYSEGPAQGYDFQEPYLRTVLGFIGITDVEVVRVEGVALGDDAVRQAMTSATQRADEIARALTPGAAVAAA